LLSLGGSSSGPRMREPQAPLLLDTHAALWSTENAPISRAARSALNDAHATGFPVFVSPMTAWEIGMLVSKNRLGLSARPQVWFDRLLQTPGVYLADLTPEILVLSSYLPGAPPKDPTDRIIAATAREGGYRLVTRDRVLLAYAAQGHLQAIPC